MIIIGSESSREALGAMQAKTRYSTGLSLLFLLLTVSPAPASDEYPWPEEYTILCSSEERSGLNWVNGTWKPAQFKNTQRLIVKSNENRCGEALRGDIHLKSGYHSKQVCLNERELGDKYDPVYSYYCEEHFYEINGDLYINCDIPKLLLTPNGGYHLAKISDIIDKFPKDDYKDSQFVEVGKCSMIKP